MIEGAVDKMDGRKQGGMLCPPPKPDPQLRQYAFHILHACILGNDSNIHNKMYKL